MLSLCIEWFFWMQRWLSIPAICQLFKWVNLLKMYPMALTLTASGSHWVFVQASVHSTFLPWFHFGYISLLCTVLTELMQTWWNLNWAFIQMFPIAVTCGNTFVLKPSEKDPGLLNGTVYLYFQFWRIKVYL